MKRFALPLVGVVSVLTLLGQGLIGQPFSFKIENFSWPRESELYSQSPGTSTDMKNFDVVISGNTTYLRKRAGCERILPPLSATNGSQCVSAFYFYQPTTVNPEGTVYDYILAVKGAELYYTRYGNNYWTEITHGPGASALADQAAPGSFVTFKDTLIFTHPSADSVYVSNGIAVVDPSDAQDGRYDTPYNYCFVHNRRVYFWGGEAADGTQNKIAWWPEYRIDFEDSTTSGCGSMHVNREDGDILRRVEPLGQYIIAYKSRSIYRITIDPSTNAPYSVELMATTGAISRNAVASAGNYHAFVSMDGCYLNDGTSVRKISQDIDYWFRDSLANGYGTGEAVSVAYFRNRFYFLLPLWNGTSWGDVYAFGHRVFCWDPATGAWSKYVFGNGGAPNTGFTGNDCLYAMPMIPYTPKPYSTGVLTQSDRLFFVIDTVDYNMLVSYPASISDLGGTIEAIWRSGFLNIGSMAVRKRVDRVIFQGVNADVVSPSLSLSWYADNGTSAAATTALSCGSVDWCWGSYSVTPKVTGSAIMMKVTSSDSSGTSIYGIELEGVYQGYADQ